MSASSVMDNTFTVWSFLRAVYVLLVFLCVFFMGLVKGLLVGPVATLILTIGNTGVILGLLPLHIVLTCYTLLTTNRFNAAVKMAILLALPALFVFYLVLGIGGSFLLGAVCGFLCPWVLTFEAFRNEQESKKFMHCVVDGTWETIQGSSTLVRDFADLGFHSYPVYLEELRTSPALHEKYSLRLHYVPACILVALLGLIVDVPLYTLIIVIKSPYMLFKGWFRLIHDLIAREGPFLEMGCIPIAGLAIIMWPAIVTTSILGAILSSIFIALYGSVVVYQESSFRSGIAYVISLVAEFDEYTNDRLSLPGGTILPKPVYRKRKKSRSPVTSDAGISSHSTKGRELDTTLPEAPALLVPRLAQSRPVNEIIQEVKVVQIWNNIMRSYEMKGKQLVDDNIIKPQDLCQWIHAENNEKYNEPVYVVSIGIPCSSLLRTLLHSIEAGSDGLLMCDNVEVTYFNKPKDDKLLDWFFNPVLVLKEQIQAVGLGTSEHRFLEELTIFGSDHERINRFWEDNGNLTPLDPLRAAQIQGISRRMVGIVRSISKLPTYRRKFRQMVRDLIVYAEYNSAVTSIV